MIEVDGSIDEIDVLSVEEGSRTVVTLDALPGQAFVGEVVKIGTTGASQEGGGAVSFGPFGGPPQSVVTYSIRVRVTAPDGLRLPEGLSALAQVVIKEKNDVSPRAPAGASRQLRQPDGHGAGRERTGGAPRRARYQRRFLDRRDGGPHGGRNSCDGRAAGEAG